MPQFFSEYLFPANPITIGIITFLIGFFLVWLIGLIRYWRWLRTERIQIENCKNIQPLVTARHEQDRGHEDNDQKVDPENAFSDFCKESSLNRRSPITKHLKAIFLAGWDETRLEVGELINHTTADLFKWNNLFRSMLAVFIVIGLFGTLFGLADSITGLSPALKEPAANEISTENNDSEEPAANKISTENNGKITKALEGLLNKVKGALAPSISGIFFTILGVILYGIFLQSACTPVKSTLERLTLTVWVPQLYPTTSQKLMQTLQKSESQMQRGFETAAQFSESVQKVHGNIDDFNESLTQATAITQPLSDSVTQINKAASDISTAADVLNTGFTESLDKFSSDFASSVTQLTGFQDEIRNLHRQFQEDANQKLNQFQDATDQKLDLQTEKLDDQNQNISKIREAIDQTLNALKSYETTYVNSHQEINNKLQEFIDKATETNTSIYTENRKWFEKINNANKQQFSDMQEQLKTELGTVQQTLNDRLGTLVTQLETNLSDIQDSLNGRLDTLNDRLENFDTPLKKTVEEIKHVFDERLTTLNERLEKLPEPIQESADQMRNTYADLVVHMRTIVGELQRKVIEINQKYEEQLTGVKDLNQKIVNLLSQLDESSKNQKETVGELSKNIGRLTEDINNLDSAIKTFTSDSGEISQSIGAIKGHVETLGNASQELVQKADVTPLNTNIGRLNATIEQISQNSQTLAYAVNQLTKQIDLSETSEPEQNGKKRSIFSKLNPLSRRKKDGR